MNTVSETSTIYDVAKTRLSADIKLEHAKAVLCHFGGAGLFAAMLGAGIGLACAGYSYVVDGRAQSQKMADAIVRALETARLTTTGEVKLAEGSIVGLAPGGQVALAPNSTVRVDPSSLVQIASTVTTGTRPTSTIPSVQVPPTSETKVITQYTTFKSVGFDKGSVVTGWRFDNSNQTTPSAQYCYYDEPANDKTHVRIDLGENGTIVEGVHQRAGLDVRAAFTNCVWFQGV